MNVIDRNVIGLEQECVVEALASVIQPEWVTEALVKTDRMSERRRRLPAPFVLWFVVLLGLHRRVSYENLLEKLHGSWWTQDNWKPEECPCSSAVTKARDRLGVEPVRELFKRSSEVWLEQTSGLIFHGRRVYAIDGATLKTPDSPKNRREFGKPKGGRGVSGYPQLRMVALMDVGTHIFSDLRIGPFSVGEMTLTRELIESNGPGDLVLMDRNFLAYDLLWDLHEGQGADFVVRVKRGVQPRCVRVLGEGDRIVEIDIPRYFRRRRPDMPRTWRLREITYRPEGGKETIRLFVTIFDESVPAEELADLYHERWEEEGAFDELKTHLCSCTQVNRPVVFRSMTPKRVEQELYGLLIAHNAVRMIMWAASCLVPICCLRLSYTAAIERIRETTRDMMQLRAIYLPQRYEKMLEAIGRSKVPKRPGRHNPRCVKMKMSRYPLKRPSNEKVPA